MLTFAPGQLQILHTLLLKNRQDGIGLFVALEDLSFGGRTAGNIDFCQPLLATKGSRQRTRLHCHHRRYGDRRQKARRWRYLFGRSTWAITLTTGGSGARGGWSTGRTQRRRLSIVGARVLRQLPHRALILSRWKIKQKPKPNHVVFIERRERREKSLVAADIEINCFQQREKTPKYPTTTIPDQCRSWVSAVQIYKKRIHNLLEHLQIFNNL